MNVDSIQNTAQLSEQYRIRAKREEQSAQQVQEAQKANQVQQIQQEQRVQEQRAAEVDTYDKDNPAGVQAEGVYSLSHDESGNLTVNYVQPASKSEGSGETQSSEKSQSASKSQAQSGAAGAGGAGTVSESSSTSSDDELEELERQKNAIQQQLNRESDENVKAQLRTQLQNIEAQIIQLKIN